MSGIWDNFSRIFGNEDPTSPSPPPSSPALSPLPDNRKRSASSEAPEQGNTRRLRGRASQPHPVVDLYEGSTREAYQESARQATSHSLGRSLSRSLPVPGARAIGVEVEDIKDRIDHLPVSKGKKERVRQAVADDILGSPRSAEETPDTSDRDISVDPPMVSQPARKEGPKGKKEKARRMEHQEPVLRKFTREDWEKTPNQVVRDIIDFVNNDDLDPVKFPRGDRKRIQLIVQDELRTATGGGEPVYAIRDAELRDNLWQVQDKMERFATEYFSFELDQDVFGNHEHLTKAFSKMKPETVKVIGNVASGGPAGANGWRDLFYDEQKRCALVCAIIGNVLSHQVYQHAFFGGSLNDVQELEKIQRDNKDYDGKSHFPWPCKPASNMNP